MGPGAAQAVARPRRVLKERYVQARFEALHLDAAARLSRREELARDKVQREEAEAWDCQRRPSRSCQAGWVEMQLREHQRRERERQSQRIFEASRREREILRECSFTPRILPESAEQRRRNRARRSLADLAARQRGCLAELGEGRGSPDGGATGGISVDVAEVLTQVSRLEASVEAEAADLWQGVARPPALTEESWAKLARRRIVQELADVDAEARRVLKEAHLDEATAVEIGFDLGLLRRLTSELQE